MKGSKVRGQEAKLTRVSHGGKFPDSADANTTRFISIQISATWTTASASQGGNWAGILGCSQISYGQGLELVIYP